MPNLGQHFILQLLLLCVHMCVLTWVWVPEHVCEGQRTIFKIPFSSATWFFRRRLLCCFCHMCIPRAAVSPFHLDGEGLGWQHITLGLLESVFFFFFYVGSRDGTWVMRFVLQALLPLEPSYQLFYFFIILIWDRTSCFKLRLASNSCQIKTITLRDGGGPHF